MLRKTRRSAPRKILMIMVGGCIAAWASYSYALSCVASFEVAELTLQSVSEDGMPVGDVSPYEGYAVELKGASLVELRAVRGNEEIRELYYEAR